MMTSAEPIIKAAIIMNQSIRLPDLLTVDRIDVNLSFLIKVNAEYHSALTLIKKSYS